MLDSGLCPWSTAVPSFNYTTPFSTSDLAREQTHLYNIHGTLAKNNIIFGIDGQNIGEFDDGMPFTKTYRLLTMEQFAIGRWSTHPMTRIMSQQIA